MAQPDINVTVAVKIVITNFVLINNCQVIAAVGRLMAIASGTFLEPAQFKRAVLQHGRIAVDAYGQLQRRVILFVDDLFQRGVMFAA